MLQFQREKGFVSHEPTTPQSALMGDGNHGDSMPASYIVEGSLRLRIVKGLFNQFLLFFSFFLFTAN